MRASTLSRVRLSARSSYAWRRELALPGAKSFALPRGVVLLMGLVCFVVFLLEGSMLDWSAVFLHEVRAIDLAHAGWGFVAFHLEMTSARLVGDRIVARLGRSITALAGGSLGCAALLVVTLATDLRLVLAGFALLGIGCANIVPVMLTLAGQQTRMPESLAIAVVTTMGDARDPGRARGHRVRRAAVVAAHRVTDLRRCAGGGGCAGRAAARALKPWTLAELRPLPWCPTFQAGSIPGGPKEQAPCGSR